MNNNVTIALNGGFEIDKAKILEDRYFLNKFSIGIGELITRDKDGLLKNLKDFDNKQEEFIFKDKKNEENIIYIESSNYGLRIEKLWKKNTYYVEIYANSLDTLHKIYNYNLLFFSNDSENIELEMTTFYFEKNDLEQDSEEIKEEDVNDISELFYPDFSDVNLFFKEFLTSNENITILSGEPGTGKSKFVTLALKYILENGLDIFKENTYVKVAYVKNEDVLISDEFWNSLKHDKFNVVIFDDLDYFLSPREQIVDTDIDLRKNKFISNFLSFTDGIIKNKTKFFITTNKEISSIDEALMRDGRMFCILSFSRLSYDEALVVWKNSGLNKEDFESEFKINETIVQSKLGSLINKYKVNSDGHRSFLKEGSKADITKKFEKRNKIGF